MRIVHLLPAMLGAGLLFAAPAHAQAARNYDCSKAGNANKSVCKQAAAAKPAAPATASAATTAKTRTYNCALAGNANKTACKTAAASAPAPAAPAAPAARATSISRSTSTHSVSRSTTGNAAGPNGATAICNDGTYSHSAHHSGSCSHHGGVKQFY